MERTPGKTRGRAAAPATPRGRRRASRTAAGVIGAALVALALPSTAGAAERGIEMISPAESLGLRVLDGWGNPNAPDHGFVASDTPAAGLRPFTRTPDGWQPGALMSQHAGVLQTVLDQSVDGRRALTKEKANNVVAPGTRINGIYLHELGRPVTTVISHPNPVDSFDAGQPFYYYGADEQLTKIYGIGRPGEVPGATSSSGLYRWSEETRGFEAVEIQDPRLQACSSYTATYAAGIQPVVSVGQSGVSADGERVIVRNNACTVPGSSPVQTVREHLYLWEDGVATDISVPLPGESDLWTHFLGMTPDASRIFFFKSTGVNAPPILYVHENGQTTKIEGPPGSTNQANPVVSPDGSSLWFVARTTGPAEEHLYRWKDGAVQRVATGATGNFSTPTGYSAPEVSNDGSAFLLHNAVDLTSRGTAGTRQFHRITAGGTIDCVSCPPPGVTPQTTVRAPSLNGGPRQRSPRIAADGSTVAIETAMPLVPTDVNGKTDVYLWRDGRHELISTGTVGADAEFRSMSWDASSVFFASWGAFLPGTTDTYLKLYVSRIGGGFPAPKVERPCGDSCQGAATPQPVLPLPGSPSFVGPGNVVPSEGDEPKASGKVRATRPKAVRGTKAVVRVRVPGKGRIRTSGWGLKRGSRKTTRSTTYRVNVRLTSRATRTLRRKGTIKTRVTVRFTPAEGKTQTVRVAATFKRSKQGSSRAVVGGEL